MTDELHYDDESIAFLEQMWGDGFLSPGGPAEVARIVGDLDLTDLTVLDIGCGVGGATMALARDHGAGRVVGVDVEEPGRRRAIARVDAAGLADRVEIRLVEPGPLPFADASFDIVFSKDSIVHIPDKVELAADVFRVLRPGGWFIASDWLIAHEAEPSPEMRDYLIKEDLGFGMASPAVYRRALEAAGFVSIALDNRNQWYQVLAREELARLTGPEQATFERLTSRDEVVRQIDVWSSMVVVVDSGEHCPHHLRARKPG